MAAIPSRKLWKSAARDFDRGRANTTWAWRAKKSTSRRETAPCPKKRWMTFTPKRANRSKASCDGLSAPRPRCGSGTTSSKQIKSAPCSSLRLNSLTALVGAIAADMFVVGDIRDLVIQGGRLAVDGDSDELILALSAVGVLTTVMPEVDWIAAFLKVAKKAGALSKRMVEALVRVIRRATDTRDYGELRRLFGHFKVLTEKSTPAGALRLLRHIDDPKEVEAVVNFLKRQPSGGFVLHVAGKEGVDIVKTSAREAEDVLALAARKG